MAAWKDSGPGYIRSELITVSVICGADGCTPFYKRNCVWLDGELQLRVCERGTRELLVRTGSTINDGDFADGRDTRK